MDFFYDIFRYEYLMNALLAAVFAGITCGIVGTYVVARRMVFLCGGVTHASFGGLGIAVYMGANPIAGAMVFAVLSALGIEWAGDRGRIREDSAIGIIWSVGMAVGALFMSLTPGYTSGDLSSYMFGSIVTVTTRDVATLGVLTLFCIVGAVLWWRLRCKSGYSHTRCVVHHGCDRGPHDRALDTCHGYRAAVVALYDPRSHGECHDQILCRHHTLGCRAGRRGCRRRPVHKL